MPAVRMSLHPTTQRHQTLTGRFLQAAFVMTSFFALVSSQGNRLGYIGCFGDSWGRALEVGPKNSDSQSVEWCFRYCLESGSTVYKYAGLEYGWQCFCGNSEDYGRHGRKPDSDCQDECVGNSQQICGDSWRISIYQISRGVCSNDIGPPTHGRHSVTNPRSLSYNLNDFKLLGTRVDFSCDSGYTLQGASSIECVDTGTNRVIWNDTLPTCQVPEPTYTTHTTSSPTVRVSTTTITFQQTAGTDDTSRPDDPTTGSNDTDTSAYGTAWSTSSAPPTASPKAPASGSEGRTGASLSSGTIAALAVAAALLVILAAILLAVILAKKRRKRESNVTECANTLTFTNTTYDLPQINGASGQPSADTPPVYSQVVRKKPATDDVSPRTPDVITDLGQPEAAQEGLVEVGDAVYANAQLQGDTGESGRDGKVSGDQPEDDEETGWVENIIYE